MADGFDEAIMGIAERCARSPVVVYDAQHCIDILVGLGVDEGELRKHPEKERVKNLWKLGYPPLDLEQRWTWICQVEDHLFGTRQMQNELLKAWRLSYRRKDRRKKPLRDKMGGMSLRARDREFKILQLRSMNLSFRQIGAQLGISHVAAYKRYWWAMDESLFSEQRRERCLISIRDLLEGWIRYCKKVDSTASEKGNSVSHRKG